MSLNNEKENLLNRLAEYQNSETLMALWHAGKGDWHKAHNLAQKQEGTRAYDRIHAYLHRVEGDQFNAKYWYHSIGLSLPTVSLDEEWNQLALEYLKAIK